MAMGKMRRYKRKKTRRPNRANSSVRISDAPSILVNPSSSGNMTVIPDRYMCKLNFVDLDTVNSFTSNQKLYRGNGPYDPEVPIGGGQPAGFDQLLALYKNYRVHSSAIHVELAQSGSTAHAPWLISVRPNSTNTFLGRIPETESPYCKYIVGTGNEVSSVKLYNYMGTKKLLGLKSIDQEENLTGDSANFPATQWYWSVSMSSMDAITNISCERMVKITYWIEFFNRKDILDG